MPKKPRVGPQPQCTCHASKENYKRRCVDAREQGQLLPNRLITQAEPLRPFRFFRKCLSRPGITEYEKEHATCVPNDGSNWSRKWVVSESNRNKQCRQSRNGDNDEHSPFLEKYKAGDSRAFGIAVCESETFDQGHIAIRAAVNVGQIFGLALGAEHARPRL